MKSQVRRERDCSSGRGPERSVATAHDLYRTMEFMDVFREPELLNIKLPIASLGTVDFSRPREGRYYDAFQGRVSARWMYLSDPTKTYDLRDRGRPLIVVG